MPNLATPPPPPGGPLGLGEVWQERDEAVLDCLFDHVGGGILSRTVPQRIHAREAFDTRGLGILCTTKNVTHAPPLSKHALSYRDHSGLLFPGTSIGGFADHRLRNKAHK